MSKTRILFILGVWVAVLPYLGFPTIWKNILFTLSGLGLALGSYMIRKDAQRGEGGNFDNFSENGDFAENTEREDNKIN